MMVAERNFPLTSMELVLRFILMQMKAGQSGSHQFLFKRDEMNKM